MNTSVDQPISREGGLSTGAKAGIGAGVGLAGLLITLTFIGIVLLHRRKRSDPNMPEMTGHSLGLKRFLGGKWRSEVEGRSEPVEIDSRGVRVVGGPPVELAATERS
jgi:hypothetical protein